MERLIIFDTTLRDGEQSPGAALRPAQKLELAGLLARLGVDVIEAGFPAASPGDFEAVRAIAAEVRGPVICGLARADEADVRACARALTPTSRPRIHLFIGTSPLHREAQLGLSRAEVLRRAEGMTRLARELCPDVEFSPMDASRTEPEFLAEVVRSAIAAGATTVNIPDTVGYSTPDTWRELLLDLRDDVPELSRVVLSVHCHNDLGLASANSLAGIRAGARQVEVCVNGIGERAGNCALEEVVVVLGLHADEYGVECAVDHSLLIETSRMVSRLTGMPVQPNKAVVGANAFAHASGIHQDGVLKDRRTFEILDPHDLGTESRMPMGKLSGRHALGRRLAELGFEVAPDRLPALYTRFKRLADGRSGVSDRELLQLARRDRPVVRGTRAGASAATGV
ncbi:MAG: 2-isopropylmalate synthase [Candidatus Dormibacteria bacterium]